MPSRAACNMRGHVKRLIVLLIVLAGGLAAACLRRALERRHGQRGRRSARQQLNSDLNAIARQCRLPVLPQRRRRRSPPEGRRRLPSIEGSGQSGDGSVAPHGVDELCRLLPRHARSATSWCCSSPRSETCRSRPRDLTEARTELTDQITAVPVRRRRFAVRLRQRGHGCRRSWAPCRPPWSTRPSSSTPRRTCWRRTWRASAPRRPIWSATSTTTPPSSTPPASRWREYTSEADADGRRGHGGRGHPVLHRGGTDARRGPQGCDILYGVASSLPAGTDLESLPLNTVSSPIAVNSNYLLIEITKRTPTSFAQARTEVESAVQAAGATKAGTIDRRGREERRPSRWTARYGEWIATQVLPPPSPPASRPVEPDGERDSTRATTSAHRAVLLVGGAGPSPHHGGGPGARRPGIPDRRRCGPCWPAAGRPSCARPATRPREALSGYVALRPPVRVGRDVRRGLRGHSGGAGRGGDGAGSRARSSMRCPGRPWWRSEPSSCCATTPGWT